MNIEVTGGIESGIDREGNGNNHISCDFCGRRDDEATHIFYSRSKNVNICNYCILILSKQVSTKQTKPFEIYTPGDIKRAIQEYVYGQDIAIREISVCLFKHLHSANYQKDKEAKDEMVVKSNMLLIGPTGSGKTYIMDVAAKMLDIPILFVDCTMITATGYIGDDVESILARAYKKADSNLYRAERGIIFLDEFDKLAAREATVGRDIKGEAVQQELLRIIEGTRVDVMMDNKRIAMGRTISLDTKKMLFIAAGAFTGLEDKIKRARMSKSNTDYLRPSVGKKSNDKDIVVFRNSLIEYGIIPELAARFSSIGVLRKLAIEDMLNILYSRESRIRYYTELLMQYDIIVRIDEEVYSIIANYAYQLEIGARGINFIVDKLFNDILLMIDTRPKNKISVNITAEFAERIINNVESLFY